MKFRFVSALHNRLNCVTSEPLTAPLNYLRNLTFFVTYFSLIRIQLLVMKMPFKNPFMLHYSSFRLSYFMKQI
jgi:hypothetical protein